VRLFAQPSIPSVNPTLAKTNSTVEDEGMVEDERCNLAKEILRLSPPQPGCEERARFILERRFSLAELQILVEALRDGFPSVVTPEQRYYTNWYTKEDGTPKMSFDFGSPSRGYRGNGRQSD
jgi:hypothetical protein